LIAPGFWTLTTSKDPVYAGTALWGVNEPEKSYAVTAERTPMVGLTNCQEGQNSGQKCGKIAVIGVMGLTTAGLIEEEGMSATKDDSGAPILFINSKNSEVQMEGTLVGGRPSTGQILYEPLKTTLTDLGLELLTTANEVRP
jgi:hypothetical protein